MTTLFISHSSKDKAWAERTHKVLSDGGYQCLFLDSHPDDGIHVGADWEQTLYQRLRQSRGLVVLCSANWLASPWCVAEAMMARDRGKRVFLIATAEVADDRQVKAAGNATPPRVPDFLKDAQRASLGGEVAEDEAFRCLLHGLKKEGLNAKDFPLPDRPYPGLAPFQETDAAVYFGRDGEIDQVIAVLNRRRRSNAHGFILVLGASGCGKSSLVRAGVLPRLRRASDTRTAWVIVPPIMGGRGLDGLALTLSSALGDAGQPRALATVRDRLAAAGDLRTLGNELLAAHGVPGGAVLLVLDQLEEVFGTADGSDARALLRLLLDASADAGSPMVVLATMRSDFLNAFQLFEGAAERYEKVTLDPMPRARFAEVIEGPADRFGIDLDPGLAERMAGETAYNDALPLLAFTLEKLYEACKAQGRLTLTAYDALGGVSAAIRHVADAILKETGYTDLPADDPRMRDLRRAFYSLAQVGEEGQFTRRVARWSQMPDACKPLLQRFVDQRLLVSDTANGERVLGVAHEALFRVWDTLNGWLRADRKALALRSQIEDAAAEWQAENRAESRAWSEERVLDAVREIEMSGVSLDDVAEPETAAAFLGPTNAKDLEALPGLDAADDAAQGSGRYGEVWRLPLSHAARASVGVRLALLGDRRKGVGLREDGLPDIDWCAVDGGEVTIFIRTNPNNPLSAPRDVLCRTVTPFRVGRYPITVTQYRGFLEDENGWRDSAWWGDDLYRDPDGKGYQFGRFGNNPAVFVNWFDAMSYCRWLSRRLGFTVYLPDEWEWQQAAGGGAGSGLSFPWGRDWNPRREPHRANTLEAQLGRATAVGMYPDGVSSTGAQDMAGTVFEWCVNKFETPKETGLHTGFVRERRLNKFGELELIETSRTYDSALRAARGGSWFNDQGFASSSSRGWFDPFTRSFFIGFRVACSSPSPDH